MLSKRPAVRTAQLLTSGITSFTFRLSIPLTSAGSPPWESPRTCRHCGRPTSRRCLS
jgi:hypothetical protein